MEGRSDHQATFPGHVGVQRTLVKGAGLTCPSHHRAQSDAHAFLYGGGEARGGLMDPALTRLIRLYPLSAPGSVPQSRLAQKARSSEPAPSASVWVLLDSGGRGVHQGGVRAEGTGTLTRLPG